MPDIDDPSPLQRVPISRRGFLGRTAAAGAVTALGSAGVDLLRPSVARATEIGPLVGAARADRARVIRNDAATYQRGIPLPAHDDNGDEARHPDRRGSFTKALAHNPDGLVVPAEYAKLLVALRSGLSADVEKVSLPGPRQLVDPLAAYAYTLQGADSHAFSIPPAPIAESDQTQGEMAELYWMALARDIPFDSYALDGTGVIAAAFRDLNGFRDVRAPKVGGAVTVGSLFRDVLPDNLNGRFISQFLLQDVPYGVQTITQKGRRVRAGQDRLTTYRDWLTVQNGGSTSAVELDGTSYIRNGRDLAEWVHSDFPAQAVLSATLIIAKQGNRGDAKTSPDTQDRANPYLALKTQSAFVTFGNQNFLDLVTRVMQDALQAAWYQKWLVHRRARPEEHGGRVYDALQGRPFLVGDQLLDSLRDDQRLGRARSRWAGLLPTSFPEGCPTHPAYPSGHSTYVAAGVTMIKAFADGTMPLAARKRVSDPGNGDNIIDDTEVPTLTIDGELDKLVMNVGTGRLFAGVHWRSDHTYGVRLGELVAIRALQDVLRTYAETFPGFTLRRFDGTTVTVTATQVLRNGSALPLSNVVT